jgi:hypothetical protein
MYPYIRLHPDLIIDESMSFDTLYSQKDDHKVSSKLCGLYIIQLRITTVLLQ